MGSRYRVKFLFISLIAVVGEYPSASEGGLPILETSISEVMYTNRIGYAEAKLVCEKISQVMNCIACLEDLGSMGMGC